MQINLILFHNFYSNGIYNGTILSQVWGKKKTYFENVKDLKALKSLKN